MSYFEFIFCIILRRIRILIGFFIAENKARPERMFDMKMYENKSRLALLWLILIVGFFSFSPTPVRADFVSIQTLATPEESCDVNSMVSNATNAKSKWWKPALNAVVDASVAMGDQVFNKVASGAQGLMIVGAALWLAIFMLKVVGGMVESDPMENITKIGGLMLRVGIAWGLLKNSRYFFEYFFAPIIEAGAGFVDTGALGIGNVSGAEVTASGTGLRSAGNALMAMADSIHQGAGSVKAAGRLLMCLSDIHVLSIVGSEIMTFFDPGLISSGIGIHCAGFMLVAAFPFFLLDAVFRMGVTAALCPLFIAAWVFQSTRSYTSKGLNTLLNVAFVFMLVKIACLMAIKMILGSAGEKLEAAVSGGGFDDKSIVCVYRSWSFGDSDPCEGVANEGEGNGFFVAMICAIYGIFLMRAAAEKMANHFSDTGFSNDTAFQAARGAVNSLSVGANAANAVHDMGSLAKRGIKAGAKGVGNAIKGGARMFNNIRNGRGANNAPARVGAGAGGGALPTGSGQMTRLNAHNNTKLPASAKRDPKTGNYSWSHTDKSGVTTTTMADSSGNTLSRSKTDKNGNEFEKTEFKNGSPAKSTVRQFDSNGKLKSETISDGGKSTSRTFKDGKIASENVKDGNKATSKTFDEKGRVRHREEKDIKTGATKATDYNEKGHAISEYRDDGAGNVSMTDHKYDDTGTKVGAQTEIENKDGSKASIDWNYAGGQKQGGLKMDVDAQGTVTRIHDVDSKGKAKS